MTSDEIAELCTGTWNNHNDRVKAINFALLMVQRHNDEILERVKKAIQMDAREYVLETIREAKP